MVARRENAGVHEKFAEERYLLRHLDITLDAQGKPMEPQLFMDLSAAKGFASPSPMFSPDGHWLAYAAVQSGLPPSVCGSVPRTWREVANLDERRFGATLVEERARIVLCKQHDVNGGAVQRGEERFSTGTPQLLTQDHIEMRAPYTSYDAAPDGQHFVAFQFPGSRPAVSPEPTVVLNWLDDVRRQVASGQSGAAR